MQVSKQNAEIVLKLHGLPKLKQLLEKKPSDATLIALSRYKFASIFYKKIFGGFCADYLNSRGWEEVRQYNARDLNADLQAIDMILCSIEDLEDLIAKNASQAIAEVESIDVMAVMNSRVNTQLSRVSMRRSAEGDESGYWQGQYDAYETVQSMIKELS